jgi:hypothetical protein
MVRNTAVVQDGAQLTTFTRGTAQRPEALYAPKSGSAEWYWPLSGAREGADLVLLMARMKPAAGEAGWQFAGAGSDLLRVDPETLAVRESKHLPGDDATAWGAALVSDSNYDYSYGVRDAGHGARRDLLVSRSPRDARIGESLEYFTGTTWSPDVADAAPIMHDVSNQLSVIRSANGGWTLVSQQLGFGTALTAATGTRPEGPFSSPRVIDPGPQLGAGLISYNATVHPSLSTDDALLASWSVNRSDGRLPAPHELDTYRPQFRSVDRSQLER